MTGRPPLSDLCLLVVDCEHKTAPVTAEGYPSIRTPNIGRGRLILDGVNMVDEATYHAWTRRAAPQAGDLIVAREAPVGNVAIVPPGLKVCLGQRTVLVRPNPAKVDGPFLCYFLLGDYVQGRFRATATGATLPHLNMRDIRNLPMPPLPDLTVQRRVASILGAYDDLIEVNRRRIALLEEMARRLFEEWFVHFRFPGHAALPMVQTADGPLPQGWRWGRVEEMLVLQRGFDLPAPARTAGQFPVFAANGVHGSHDQWKVEPPGIVTGRSGTIGNVEMVHERFWPLNTTLYVKEFKRASPTYALLLLRMLNLKSHGAGAAVPTLNRNHVHALPVAYPPEDLVNLFERHAMDSLTMSASLRRHSENLAAARDLLLPRLISGELSVVAAERELEAAA